MFGFLMLTAVVVALVKVAVDGHKKYENGASDGVPFWFSPIALVFSPAVLVAFPWSFGVPLWFTMPCEIVYGVFAIRAFVRSSRKYRSG